MSRIALFKLRHYPKPDTSVPTYLSNAMMLMMTAMAAKMAAIHEVRS
jgi:hypothetical protein